MARRPAPAKKKTAARKVGAAKAAPAALDASTRIGVLYEGDTFLRALMTDALRAALTEAHGEIEVVRFQGGETPIADVLDECRSFGLMQQHKLVIVDEADQLVKDTNRQIMERYAAAPADNATLLLRADKWNKGKLDKLIAACGAVIKCEEMTPQRAASWARQRISKRYGAELAPDGARLLVERVGPALGRLDTELQKLAAAAAAQGAKEVGAALVKELVEATAGEEDIWPLQAQVLEGDPEHAVRSVREAIEVSRHAPTLVNWALVDLARKLHALSALIAQGVRPFDAAKAIRLWGDGYNLMVDAAQRARPADMAALLDEAIELDRRSKSGALHHEIALERLALRFASLTR